MKILVTYKSVTGFTKHYAELIARQVNCTLLDFKGASEKAMSEFDVVVYGARVHAGKISGLSKAKEMFAKSGAKKLIVFATGATPAAAAEEIEKVHNANISPSENIPFFYMQSGLRYEKMPLGDRMIMKAAASMMSKKNDKSDVETGFEQAIKSSYDMSSDEFVQPLVKYLNEELNIQAS